MDDLKLHIKWVHKFDVSGDYFCLSINEFFHNLMGKSNLFETFFFIAADLGIVDSDKYIVEDDGMGNYFFVY